MILNDDNKKIKSDMKQDWQIVFCGFGPLGLNSLKALLENNYKVDYVLTHKDNSLESIDGFCQQNNIKYSYENPQKKIFYYHEELIHLENPVLISVNYRFILPKEFISIFTIAFNIHGSLLPKYRGRTPHVWAIINGEEYTGVTSHIIVERVDAGDIIIQEKIKIEENDTGNDIVLKYNKIYPQVVLDTLYKIKKSNNFISQNEENATYFGKRVPDMGYLDPFQETKKILNFVRALAPPYPGAYYFTGDGRKIIIEKVSIQKFYDEELSVGMLKKKGENFYLQCLEDTLLIEKFNWE